jgi:dTDP-4-amino-4,6-dideoxygalactose transaminase
MRNAAVYATFLATKARTRMPPPTDRLDPQHLAKLVERYRLPDPVTVTRPTMPPLADYTALLEGIWSRRWLTNDGQLHRELEAKLAAYLGVEHISLFCNGAIALLVALQALRINGGEVITTPFTFPATTHVLHWNRVRPVFCDIEEETFNIDASKIEKLIGPDTRAILGVHVYGNPCQVDAIQAVADRHGLQVVYDAAHAFGVRLRGESLLLHGNMSMLSFHATKVFSTMEGGALVSRSDVERRRVNMLKNFGIADEETVIGPGINGKMNEAQAAFGLLQLRTIDEEIGKRRAIAESYRRHLAGIQGVRFLKDLPDVGHNYGYFPVLIDEGAYGLDRDTVYAVLKKFNVNTRKYFHPLVSRAPSYAALPSAHPGALPVAERVARQVLCLPIYGTLDPSVPETVATLLRALNTRVA